MTIERPAKTFDQATTTVAGMIGWPAICKLTGRSDRAVRYWSQPNCKTSPTLRQAAAMDSAYRAAGGQDAPFTDALAHAVDVAYSAETACYRALASDTAEFVREAGELGAALIEAIQPGASPRAHNRALVEAQQVETALDALLRRLPRFLQFGAGSNAGNTGGYQ
jgi:hypothetical protein